MADLRLALIVSMVDQFTQPFRRLGQVAAAGVSPAGLDRLSAAGRAAVDFGGRMAVAGVLTGEAAGMIHRPLDGLIDVAGSFEHALNRARVLGGVTGTALEQLRDTALTLQTAAGPTEVVDTLTELTKAGLSAGDAMAALPQTLALAQAGELPFATAAQIAENMLHTFNLSAGQMGRVADTLAKAANTSATDVQAIGLAVGYAGGRAVTAGQSIEQVSARRSPRSATSASTPAAPAPRSTSCSGGWRTSRARRRSGWRGWVSSSATRQATSAIFAPSWASCRRRWAASAPPIRAPRSARCSARSMPMRSSSSWAGSTCMTTC